MAHHNDLIGHNSIPDRNNQIPHAQPPSRPTALTPQNQPESPLLRGNQPCLCNPVGPVQAIAVNTSMTTNGIRSRIMELTRRSVVSKMVPPLQAR